MEPYQLSTRYIISGLIVNGNSPERLIYQGRRRRKRNMDIAFTPEFIRLPERVFCWVQLEQITEA
jgi:hypothetical protein